MAGNNSGGPWGGGFPGNDNDRRGQRGGDQRPGPGGDPNIPDMDEFVRKGQERLRSLMGGRGGGIGRGSGGSGSGRPVNRAVVILGILALIAGWLYLSLYRVDTSEQSVELLFGEYYQTGTEGLNFAPWPIFRKEVVPVTRENTEDIGIGTGTRSDEGLMLTGDENIVDIDFQVVWNIRDLPSFLFNLAAPDDTIRAVSESAMREIVARSNLAPILNRDRELISQELQELIQDTLDSYEAGVNIVRVNFDKADPPREVIDAFREVQAAEQTRDTLEKQADAYANQVVAEARGEAARLQQEAEGYRAQVVNVAEGEASRFLAVLQEYSKAEEVTRKRLYLETIEKVLADVDKIIIDEGAESSQGVVPYLPLNELRRSSNP